MLLISLCAACLSAASQEVHISSGRPATILEKLHEQGISSDEASLVIALGNSNPKIRGMAALELAEQKAKDALSPLLVALNAEKEPKTRVDMALSVSQLGDGTGVAELRATCDGKSNVPDLRLRAAAYLQDFLGDDHCRNIIEELAAFAPDPDSRIYALDLLTSQTSMLSHDAAPVRRVVIKALDDKDPTVRIAASEKMSQIGKKSDSSMLRRAIAKEVDPNARSAMEADLNTLLKKRLR